MRNFGDTVPRRYSDDAQPVPGDVVRLDGEIELIQVVRVGDEIVDLATGGPSAAPDQPFMTVMRNALGRLEVIGTVEEVNDPSSPDL